MSDIFLEWEGDLELNPDGDIKLADGWDEIRQRVIRLALTTQALLQASGIFTPCDYHFHPDYGLGLRAFVGETFDDDVEEQMRDLAATACLKDPDLSNVEPPQVSVEGNPIGNFEITVNVQLQVGEPQQLVIGA